MDLSRIGSWSEAKLEIVRDYGKEYSKILSNQRGLSHAYIDAFSGPGSHRSKTTGELIPGSPLNALAISPPFADYYFIDTGGKKMKALAEEVGDHPRVHLYQGDCNDVLVQDVYPRVQYDDFQRALL